MNSKNLIIIGAGGHGRVAYDIAYKSSYEKIYFLDDELKDNDLVIGKCDDFLKYISDFCFFVAIGNATARHRIFDVLKDANAEIASLIAPSAVISRTSTIGTGSIVMEGAVINTDSVIGEGVIINTCSSVDHDCVIGDFCHISVGSHLCGNVKVGENTWIGAGATVINNISICENCMIGAGAVVVKNITQSGVFKGVPAK